MENLKRRPLTVSLIALSVAWTTWVLTSTKTGYDWRRFGISDGFEVFSGEYWTLLTSMFVHVGVVHLFFNAYWLYILGGYVEERFGWRFYALLVLISGFCSSTLELSVADSTGVGLSGVAYAIFGLLWGARWFAKEDIEILPPQTIRVFMIWLVLCIVATESGAMSVGNVAHVTGLLVGLATAYGCASPRKFASYLTPLLVALCGAALFYSPWSTVWLASKAARAHQAKQWDTAERYYSRVLARDPNDRWALENRGRIRVYHGHEAEGQADLVQAEKLKQKER